MLSMNEYEQKVKDFIIRELKRNTRTADISANTIDESCNMLENGLVDSFGFIELLASVEKEFNIEIDFSTLDPAEFITFKGLVFQCASLAQKRLR